MEPSVNHVLGGDANRVHRVSRVTEGELLGRSAEEMAALLKQHIDSRCIPDNACASHIVVVDEIGNHFSDRRGGEGAALTRAMRILDGMPSPFGGSYASRVHFYIAPAFVTAVGYGLGPRHNLGRDGVAHRTTWRKVLPGLARAGGVWLLLYRPVGGSALALEKRAWEIGPRDFVQLYMRHREAGANLSKVHLMMSNPGVPPGERRSAYCASHACQWRLATDRATINPRLVQNGAGQFQLSSKAACLAWLRGYNANDDGTPPPDTSNPEVAAADAELLARHKEAALLALSGKPVLKVLGKARKVGPRLVAVKLQSRQTIRVAFLIGEFTSVKRVKKGTRKIIFRLPRLKAKRAEVELQFDGQTIETFTVSTR
jgi:hypothetical protein